ncbi:pyridoxamine 5'-phosphate oxidase family protein [Rothia uropygioeca]|uniref:pyridoxamine 5'-phosphate oxidase family protein n=1 Tax=Kocuria sp. 257 TaxID=2021970 RepID=UPI001EE02E01|nr:pyridoxamine 5'-phosphate oxidase family protein [Kocuria sp. 257]
MNMPMNISGEKRSYDDGPRVRELTHDESWQVLSRARIARFVTVDEGEIDITPLNIFASDGRIYFRTAPGSKLTKLQLNPNVALETDKIEGAVAHSVVVRGSARLLTDPAETDRVAAMPLFPWVRTEKLEFVEITPTEITGRRFRLGD